ncbi:MAG: TraR/DksA family transcriptional regulator [Acidimicrobiia bacterium]
MAKTTKKNDKAAEAAPVASPFPQEFIDAQKELLLQERARYIKSADALKAEADALMNEREPGDTQFDEESGEGDSLAVERERDLALSAQARAAVELIDAALGRIEAGTYGICIHSGQPIPQERLEAIPWAAERVEYKTGSFRT